MKYIALDEAAYTIHANAVAKGFWTEKDGEDQVNQILAKMMLIDTEVSELADAYVKQRGEAEIKKEMADILIRLLDLFEAMRSYGIVSGRLEDVVDEKIKFNALRPPKHNRLM